ncbi:ABC transporter substrate-binding protein [Rhizomonospora bruguierae]|uniref:ABC transporter substrate-binding protein n=1 Tax=Rhizomonospora bruguierae TaxID=1581705 RepID=UPI001BCB26AD|nr:extracellular solute-binding protein [Micromonospora sp. NBRC 107566]
MSVTSRRLRSIAAVALVAGLGMGTAACSNKKDDDGGSSDSGPVTVVLQTFGNFGYDQAIKDFEASHPNIKVDHQKMGELRDFQPKLVQALAAGSGAGDVVGLEEGVLLQYVAAADKFADLNALGAGELKSQFPEWKWARATTPQGKTIGLGTDVGGLAICYRKDMFAQAKLPTDRDEVGKLWASGWDAFIEQGKKFKASGIKAAWIDSATSIMQPYIMQNSQTWFYSEDNKFIGDTNPVVRTAWDKGLEMAKEGLTAKVQRWQPDWDAAFKNNAFATIPCPAWMTEGVIKPKSGDANAGKWDVAPVPGGSGNWGGSYLGIPEQSKHKPQAYELAKYLTGKAGQLAAWNEASAMPSNLEAAADPAFADAKSEYFSNAPIGKIFGDSVKNIQPVYLGPLHQQLWETVLEPAMQAAERGQKSSDAAWAGAMAEAKKTVG